MNRINTYNVDCFWVGVGVVVVGGGVCNVCGGAGNRLVRDEHPFGVTLAAYDVCGWATLLSDIKPCKKSRK